MIEDHPQKRLQMQNLLDRVGKRSAIENFSDEANYEKVLRIE